MTNITEYRYEVMGAISGEAWGEARVPHLRFRSPPTLEERFKCVVDEMVAVSKVFQEQGHEEPLYVRTLDEDMVLAA